LRGRGGRGGLRTIFSLSERSVSAACSRPLLKAAASPSNFSRSAACSRRIAESAPVAVEISASSAAFWVLRERLSSW
jgi:hypothetical protein